MSNLIEKLREALSDASQGASPGSIDGEWERGVAAAICDELGITRAMVEKVRPPRTADMARHTTGLYGAREDAVDALAALLEVAGR